MLFPSPEDLPDPGIKSVSLVLQADPLSAEPSGNSIKILKWFTSKKKKIHQESPRNSPTRATATRVTTESGEVHETGL